LEELYAVLDASRERQYENWKFQASLKGITLDEPGETVQERLDRIKLEAAAENRGVPVEKLHFDIIGIGIEEETE